MCVCEWAVANKYHVEEGFDACPCIVTRPDVALDGLLTIIHLAVQGVQDLFQFKRHFPVIHNSPHVTAAI
jgi:hypothetical protein